MSGEKQSKIDRLLALFWARPRGAGKKEKVDTETVDPFERFEAAIRKASENPQD